MPKLKTNRAAAKRFKKTGTGKLKRNKAYKRHILTNSSSLVSIFGDNRHILTKKTTKKKRDLRKAAMMDKTNEKVMKKILPYL